MGLIMSEIFENLKGYIEINQGRKSDLLGAKSRPIEGITSIVEDALGDLSDKLGKGGSLATLMKATGAEKLDVVKDKEGKVILQSIVAKTAEYVKDIKKLMLEAEILMAQMPD